ncbi:hypothetical protein GCM10022214_27310 [Actinomadura miaoliensis]|uniref:Transposase n=1 Tax=Actinomadura miaoliensis TaxID=430685 RepID=A0ABP7VMA9_9ACTN
MVRAAEIVDGIVAAKARAGWCRRPNPAGGRGRPVTEVAVRDAGMRWITLLAAVSIRAMYFFHLR